MTKPATTLGDALVGRAMIRVLLRVAGARGAGGRGSLPALRVLSTTSVEMSRVPELLNVPRSGKGAKSTDAKGARLLSRCYSFDRVFRGESQEELYAKSTTAALVRSLFKGLSFAVVVHGPSGSDKGYALRGYDVAERRGIIPRALEDLFQLAQRLRSGRRMFAVSATLVEVHNENLRDAMRPGGSLASDGSGSGGGAGNNGLYISESKNARVARTSVAGAWRVPIEDMNDVERVVATMDRARLRSSASHLILTVQLDQVELAQERPRSPTHQSRQPPPGRARDWIATTLATMQFVELCASELATPPPPRRGRVASRESARVKKSTQSPTSVLERQSAAKCFSSIETVVAYLRRPDAHVPYRNSKVTHLLKDCLSDNAATVLLVCVSPLRRDLRATRAAVKFGTRVRDAARRVGPRGAVARLSREPEMLGASRTAGDMDRGAHERQVQPAAALARAGRAGESSAVGLGGDGMATSGGAGGEAGGNAGVEGAGGGTGQVDGKDDQDRVEQGVARRSGFARGEHAASTNSNESATLLTERIDVPKKLWRTIQILKGLEYPHQSAREWKAIKNAAVEALDAETSKLIGRYNDAAAALHSSEIRRDDVEARLASQHQLLVRCRGGLRTYEARNQKLRSALDGVRRSLLRGAAEEVRAVGEDAVADTSDEVLVSDVIGLVESAADRAARAEKEMERLRHESAMWKSHYLEMRRSLVDPDRPYDQLAFEAKHPLPRSGRASASFKRIIDTKRDAGEFQEQRRDAEWNACIESITASLESALDLTNRASKQR